MFSTRNGSCLKKGWKRGYQGNENFITDLEIASSRSKEENPWAPDEEPGILHSIVWFELGSQRRDEKLTATWQHVLAA